MLNTYTFTDGRFLKWPFFFCLLVVVLFISNCKKQEPPRYDKVLAEVNDFKITVFDFENDYLRHLIRTGKNDTESQRYFFLNEYIDRAVLAQKASNTDLLNNDFYRTALEFQRRKSMMDAYFADQMEEILEPSTDEELRLAFAKSKRKVYVRHLFSRIESDVVEAYQRLENGEDFVDVANDFYETASYDSTAGYLGPISYFSVDDAFAEAAFSTNQEEYSKPVRSRFGYHIVFVEFIEFPAILAEDEYQYRKKGIRSQIRLRNQSIKADTYIRNLMESLLVEVSSENILELKEIIASLSDEQITLDDGNTETQSEYWDDKLLDNLRTSYDHDAELASYVFEGVRVSFTFGDYVKWLPYLLFNESKYRTGASVGRALRNEVLYKMSEKNGYSKDERVHKQIQKRGYEILSDLYRHRLVLEALADTSPVKVSSDFRESMISGRQSQVSATYWKINAQSMQEAKAIKEDILNNANPEDFDEFSHFDKKLLIPEENDYSLVRNGLLNTPIIAHTSNEGWGVLKILSRTITEINKEIDEEDLEKRFKVYKNLSTEVLKLRESAKIKVDTVLFDEIYDLYKKKQNESIETEPVFN